MKQLLKKLGTKFLIGASLQLGRMVAKDLYNKAKQYNKNPQEMKGKKKDPVGFNKETASY